MTTPYPTREFLAPDDFCPLNVAQLSDIELLALFINCGQNYHQAISIAMRVLHQVGNLRQLLNTPYPALHTLAGLSIQHYHQLQAIAEICRRSDFIHLKKENSLTSAKETYLFLKKQLRDKRNETFAALFLDSQYRVIAYEELFSGTINSATVHARPLIERTLTHNAAALILAHNHPSGLSDASTQDIAVTERLRHALELIDTKLIDHLVIGDNEVYSIMSSMKWKPTEALS